MACAHTSQGQKIRHKLERGFNVNSITIALVLGLVAVLYGLFTSGQVLRAPAGNEKMQDIAAAFRRAPRRISGGNTPPSRSSA